MRPESSSHDHDLLMKLLHMISHTPPQSPPIKQPLGVYRDSPELKDSVKKSVACFNVGHTCSMYIHFLQQIDIDVKYEFLLVTACVMACALRQMQLTVQKHNFLVSHCCMFQVNSGLKYFQYQNTHAKTHHEMLLKYINGMDEFLCLCVYCICICLTLRCMNRAGTELSQTTSDIIFMRPKSLSAA